MGTVAIILTVGLYAVVGIGCIVLIVRFGRR